MEDNSLFKVEDNETRTNEIIEIDENDEITNTEYDIPVVDKKKKNKKGKKKKLTRKGKIIIIVTIVLLLLIAAGIALYFLVLKKDKKPTHDEPEEETVIVEKDNYRFQNGNIIFKDESGDLGTYKCKNNNELLCYVVFYSNEDKFDVTEKVYESGIKIDNRSDILLGKYAFVYDDEKKEDGNIYLYDMEKEEVLGRYDLVKEIDKDKVIVKQIDSYKVLVFSSEEVSELTQNTYDYIGYIPDSETLVVSSNGNYQLLNLVGEEISKTVPGVIKNFSTNNISVSVDNEVYVYNYDGVKIIDKGYDYIRYVDDYIIAALNKRLFVFDSDGSPMIIDGIKISSNKYNTKLVYSNDLKQTGREVAFDAYITGGNLKIEYDEDKSKVINLYEGIFSKSLKYVNYFEGKLYFYSDEAKTNLIGSYTCNNKNVVNDSTKDLTNCYLATESNILKPGDTVQNYLPIYNKRFVFVADKDSTNSGNIVLWDLKNPDETKQRLARYKTVDAGYHQANDGVTFVETAGTLVAAQNTSSSYGIINIGNSEVKGFIDFKDKESGNTNLSIKYLDKDFLIKRSDNTYHVYNSSGVEITKVKITNEIESIYNNKYALVKSGNKHIIYRIDGNSENGGNIVSAEYDTIIMLDQVYVVINDNNGLEAYRYSDKTANLIDEEIIIDNDDINAKVSGNVLTIEYTSNGEALTKEVSLVQGD